MQNPIASALLILAAAVIVGVVVLRRLRQRQVANIARRAPAPAIDRSEDAAPSSEADTDIPYWTEATEEVATLCLKHAFSVARFDYQIFDDHERVLGLVDKAIEDAAEHQQYFPRRPLLLPKLLQALNDTDSTRQELVRLILEDPTLAGTALKRVNNTFYRMSVQPVESLDRAVVVLGTDGLRSLLSAAILQPVFRLPKGFFDRFAEMTWEQAQRSAAGAQAYAAAVHEQDPFVAQLLGVMRSLATLVLFRLTLDKYKSFPNVLPRPEVFIRVLQTHRNRLAADIGRTWQLSSASIDALEAQCREISPTRMSPLGRAVYYGELSSSIAVATHHSLYSPEGGKAILIHQGLTPQFAAEVLLAAQTADVSS